VPQDPRVRLEVIAYRRPSGSHETVVRARQLGTMLRASEKMTMTTSEGSLQLKPGNQWTEDQWSNDLIHNEVRFEIFVAKNHPIFKCAALHSLLKTRTFSTMATRSGRRGDVADDLVRITDARPFVRIVVHWGIAPLQSNHCLFSCRARFSRLSLSSQSTRMTCDSCHEALGHELGICPLCARFACGNCGAPLQELDREWSHFNVIRRNAPWSVQYDMPALELRSTSDAVKELVDANDLAPRPLRYLVNPPPPGPAMARLLAQEPCQGLVASGWGLEADFRRVLDARQLLRFAAGGNLRSDLRLRLGAFMMGTRRATASPVRLLPLELVEAICGAVWEST